MTYEQILAQTMPELEDVHIERYIGGYEGGTLVNASCSRCAIGHMCSEPGDTHDAGYDRYRALFPGGSDCFKWPMMRDGLPLPALVRIEVVFEGWGREVTGRWRAEEEVASDVRRRLLYDHCVMEQARRAAAQSSETSRVEVARV